MENANLMEPEIFKFDNYRNFLSRFYSFKKQNDSKFSYRFFSMRAGFKSPNFLKLIIQGERNLTNESIEKFIQVLKFNEEQSHFFRNLVHFNQAKNHQTRQYYAEQLTKPRFLNQLTPLNRAQFEYYAHWYNVAIREMVALPNFQNDPKWIAKQIIPAITRADAVKSIATLKTLGLIKEDKDGKLYQTDPVITSTNNVTKSLATKFHQQMIKAASEALNRFDSKERDISCLTFAIDETQIEGIKKEVKDFLKNLVKLTDNNPKANCVYQLNLQFFPLTQKQNPQTTTH